MKRRAVIGALLGLTCLIALVVASGVLAPFPEDLLDRSVLISTTVTARDGTILHEGFSPAGTRSDWVDGAQVPEVLKNAVIAAEDHRFETHRGFDARGIGRAIAANLGAGQVRQGGSTITQQTVKMLLQAQQRAEGGGYRARTVSNKLEELLLAVRLERRLSKREILELWLNLAPFGGSTTGVRRASLEIFGTEPRELNIAQAALLAGIPNRPAVLDPRVDPIAARRRRDLVLDRMHELGYIATDSYRQALEEPVEVGAPSIGDGLAPHAVESLLGDEYAGATRIESTIDPRLQRAVRGIIDARRRELDRHGAGAVAVAVLDNQTGEWLAWEGSGAWGDQRRQGSIDGVIAPRQPGSALKPFVYAAAFERGFTPASVLPDIRAAYPTAQTGINYVPVNYDGTYRGPVLVRPALAGSLNVPAVYLTSEIGVPSVLRLLRAASISTLDASADWYGLGVALGGGEVRLSELTAAYAAFARGGLWVQPRLLRRWRDVRGEWHDAPGTRARRIVDESTAFLVSDILSDPAARAFSFGRDSALDAGFPVAVKTGTSQAYRDNWTLGYTSRVTVGVWVGNFDRTPLRSSSGVTGAAPIFQSVIAAAEALYPSEGAVGAASNRGLRRALVCPLSGATAAAACPRRFEEWLPAGGAGEICSWHRSESAAVHYPAEYRDWLGNRAQSDATSGESIAFRITEPADGTVYLFDPTLRSEYQTVALRATGARGELTWSVNGKMYARGRRNVVLPLERGRHVIAARDGSGRETTSSIEVR